MPREYREFPYDVARAQANAAEHKARHGGFAVVNAITALGFAKTPLTDADKVWLQGANGMRMHPHKRNTVVVFKESQQ